MINFSDTPLQSDIGLLKLLSQKDDSLLKALTKEDITQLQKEIQKSALVAKKVLVHGKHGTYWATRMVSPVSTVETVRESHDVPNSADQRASSTKQNWNIKPSHIPTQLWDDINKFYDDIGDDEEFFELIQGEGVVWKESKNPKENLYRAKVAFCELSQHQQLSKQQQQQQIFDAIKNLPPITADNPLIQDVLDNSTDDQITLYKSTGMCAGDKQAEIFIRGIAKDMFSLGVINEDAKVKAKISSIPTNSTAYNSTIKLIEDTWEKENLNSMQQSGGTYKVRGVYKIEGLTVESKFQKIVESHSKHATETHGTKNGQLDTFFHGTSFFNVGQILGISGQFKIKSARTGSMLGRAIYLAPNSSKSAQYLGGHGGFFICEASLGKTLETEDTEGFDEDIANWVKSEYNAVWLHGMGVGHHTVMQPEVAVYNEVAVIPRYVVDMEISYNENKNSFIGVD